MLKILIALDGSEHSEQALQHGVALASSFESELILVRVLATAENGLRSAIDPIDWQLHKRQVQAYLERHTEELKNSGLDARWQLEEGKIAERLICCAKQANVDLIILGAIGRSGVGQFERGGTVQKVISAAHTSILVAPPATNTERTDELHYQSILVPVDGHNGSKRALKIATGIAEIHDAELILVQAIEKPELLTSLADAKRSRELQEEIIQVNRMEAERNLNALKAQTPANLQVTALAVVTNKTPDTINKIANERNVSLVVISAHSDLHKSSWHYGPLPEFLLAHTHCPVLVFQHESEQRANNFRSTYLTANHANVG